MVRFLPLALALLLSSCVAVEPLPTASGRPECTIEGHDVAELQGLLISDLVANGWMLREQSNGMLVFWQSNTSPLAAGLFGSQYDATPTNEVRFTFAQFGETVRVFGQLAVLTNEGSAFEQRTDATEGAGGHSVYAILQRLELAGSVETPGDAEQPADVTTAATESAGG